MKAPALFLGHGNPMNAIDDNLFVTTLNRLGKTLPKPKAVLVISAHWTEPFSAVSLHESELLYDMYGFPRELYMVTYPAKNGDFLIPRLQNMIPDLRVEKRALDHGVWSVLLHLFPDADVPVIELCINSKFSMREHFEMGKALGVLREEGVMIVGSGNVTHNLREAVLGDKDASVDAWAKEFDSFVKDALVSHDFDALIDFETRQRYAHLAHPTKEHYIPLLYIAGASMSDEKSRFVYEGIEHGNLSMRSWITGE
ncbi:MAG: 4,5-DOPA dioxygenase extradiol [Thiovulaceae bacterium]|nr:4,5-DOPA dioxygenase extradiol [Sulfurimonadaceae bacterium]